MLQRSIRSRFRSSAPSALLNLRLYAKAVINVCKSDRYECNVCGFHGGFLPYGNVPRRSACCAECGSIERHRLVGLWIAQNTELLSSASMLHFAPEKGLQRLFSGTVREYRTADIDPDLADTVLDIENVDLPDNSVDVVLASHVLEHVDDAKALHEIHRILSPGGIALLLFPLVDGWEHTYENPSHVTPEDRARYFGQHDHVRYYGRDVRDRIGNAKFSLAEFTAEEPNVSRYGLMRGDKLFIATKSLDS